MVSNTEKENEGWQRWHPHEQRCLPVKVMLSSLEVLLGDPFSLRDFVGVILAGQVFQGQAATVRHSV